MRSFWGGFFLIVLVACSASPGVIGPTATTELLPTMTPTLVSQPGSELVPETGNSSKFLSVTPRVETMVPDAREVELRELGLSDTTRLILYYEPTESLRIMSGQDVRPQEISGIISNEWLFGGIDMSPDQKWFAYKVSRGNRDGVSYFDYWIRSVDGKDQRIAALGIEGGTEARWVSQDRIEIWLYPDGNRVCPERVSLIDPFTREVLQSPAIPSSPSPQCFLDLSTSPDRSRIVYLQDDGYWRIYDVTTGQSQIVFPWLSDEERSTLWPRYVQWLTSSMTLVLPGQESIDFLVDLPIPQVSNSDVAMTKIRLPEGTKLYNETFPWLALENGLVGFDLIAADYDYAETENGAPPSKFVILDMKNSIWYDYDLDRARTGDRQKMISSSIFSSADQRFLAWTVYEPPQMNVAVETVVLDRETGRIARIQGFEVYGWGEVDGP